MNLTYDYTGSVAVVTGAARGVGRAITHAFVAAGARVVAADRDADGLAETCRDLGDAAIAVTADITTAAGAEQIVAAAPSTSAGSTTASTTRPSPRTRRCSTSASRCGTPSTRSTAAAPS